MAQPTHRIVPGEASEVHDEPHIEGRRITVLRIVEQVERDDNDPETVAEEFDLPVADIYRALTYYYDHPDEMAAVERVRRDRERAAREHDHLLLTNDDDFPDEAESPGVAVLYCPDSSVAGHVLARKVARLTS